MSRVENLVHLMGRLTRDPMIRHTQSANGELSIARYTLAVDRRRRSAGNDQQAADFISCVAFGRQAEFAEKYLHQGTKICVQGELQTGSYVNKDGQKVYTTDVKVDDQAFAESRASTVPGATHTGAAATTVDVPAQAAAPGAAGSPVQPPEQAALADDGDDFMDIEPSDFDSDMPFE